MTEPEYIELATDTINLITAQQAWHYKIVPQKIQKLNNRSFYISESCDLINIASELEILFESKIDLESRNETLIQQTLSKYYRNNTTTSNAKQVDTGSIKSDDFLQVLISEAKSLGSSDIHIETYEDKCRIRIRIDGHLIERYAVSKSDYPTLINKIKIKANLDISEKRLPQDGRIFFKNEDLKIDIRVSILPTLHG
jgi:type IV pilus assembly protein PilB